MNFFNLSELKIKSIIKIKNKISDKKQRSYNPILPTHELIYHFSGKNIVVFDDTRIESKTGSLIFLPKGSHKNYFADLIENGECVDVFFDAHIENPELFVLNVESVKNIEILFKKIYNVWKGKQAGYYNQARSIFYEILYEMEILQAKYVPKSKIDKITPAVEYIHLHYTDSNFQYKILPSLCGFGYTYFKKLFIKKFGLTPSEYIKHLKIQRACELLATKKFSVTEVAELCGFSDVYYFSKVFKSVLCVSPKAWE